MRLMPSALLLSDDEELVDFVRRVVKRPWRLVRQRADKFMTREVLAQPNLRLAILDDQAVDENDRGRLLAQIRKHFSGVPLLYVAGSPKRRQRETRARKRRSLLRFEAFVVRSIRAGAGIIFTGATSGVDESTPSEIRKSNMKAKESSAKTQRRPTLESVVSGWN